MKYIFLIFLSFSSILVADESTAVTQKQISETKAQIKALQDNLAKLEASLPKSVEKKEELAAAARDEANKIKTHAEFGYINNSGNTDAESIALDANIKKAWDKHALAFSIDAQYASDNDEETKNKLLTELTYNYELTDKLFFDYLTGYKTDKFSGYDYQFYTGPGLKYITIDTPEHKLVLGGNILYSKDDVRDSTEVDEYASFRARANYSWQILKNLKFEETLTYRTSFEKIDNYFLFIKYVLILPLPFISISPRSTKLNSVYSEIASLKRAVT